MLKNVLKGSLTFHTCTPTKQNVRRNYKYVIPNNTNKTQQGGTNKQQ